MKSRLSSSSCNRQPGSSRSALARASCKDFSAAQCEYPYQPSMRQHGNISNVAPTRRLENPPLATSSNWISSFSFFFERGSGLADWDRLVKFARSLSDKEQGGFGSPEV